MLSCFPIIPEAKQSVYDSSDRGGALSRSSNNTADSDDVDSGVSPEHVHAQDCPDSQESDVAISFLFFVQGFYYGIGTLRMQNGRMGVSTHYARNYAYANSFPSCLKLCQHIVREPSYSTCLVGVCQSAKSCYLVFFN